VQRYSLIRRVFFFGAFYLFIVWLVKSVDGWQELNPTANVWVDSLIFALVGAGIYYITLVLGSPDE